MSQTRQKSCGNSACETQVDYFQGYCSGCFSALPEEVQANLTRETQIQSPETYFAAQDAAEKFFLPTPNE